MDLKRKTLGFMVLHYGKDYLREALLSVVDHVDVMVIAYSTQPSQGHATSLPCPDKKEELYIICSEVMKGKLIWDEATFYPNENSHRDVRYKYVKPHHEFILTIDADEVMVGIPEALQYASLNPEQYFGINGYVNFFRSFEWVCYDGFRPIRIEKLRKKNGTQNLNCPLTVYHFSTALREELMRYKYSAFGHANEVKKNYLDEIFYKWHPVNNPIGDLHCVSIGLWNAVPFDKTRLPDYLKQHPNYNLEIIP